MNRYRRHRGLEDRVLARVDNTGLVAQVKAAKVKGGAKRSLARKVIKLRHEGKLTFDQAWDRIAEIEKL